MSPATSIRISACVAVLAVVAARPAAAQLSQAVLGRQLSYSQTGPGTVTPTGATFYADLAFSNAGDFDSATLGLPDGSSQALPVGSLLSFDSLTSSVSSTDVETAYPAGRYTFTASNAANGAMQSVDVIAHPDGTPSDTSGLTAASYTALQNLDVTSGPLTLTWNAFNAGPTLDPLSGEFGAPESSFFNIGPQNICTLFDTSVTTCTIDPSVLSPGTTYSFDLLYRREIDGFVESSGGGDVSSVSTFSVYDQNVYGTFTTAAASIAEPPGMALAGAALVPLALVRRRRGPAPA